MFYCHIQNIKKKLKEKSFSVHLGLKIFLASLPNNKIFDLLLDQIMKV